jgi:hypothetical protein
MPYVTPIDGEADRRRASLVKQASDHFSGRLLGYCLSIRNVEPKNLKVMLKILDGLVIPEFDVDDVCERLLANNQLTLSIPDSAHRERVAALCRTPSTMLSRDEFVSAINNAAGKEVNFFFSDPKKEYFPIYSKEVSLEIISICRDFVKNKMDDRPTDFYREVVGENAES